MWRCRNGPRPSVRGQRPESQRSLPVHSLQIIPRDGQLTIVLLLAAININDAAALLRRYDLVLVCVGDGDPIPGSYWGAPEAGVIGEKVYARGDTPVHSLLHEACHLIVAAPERRPRIHTDASDSQAEEDACCYLQIVLGDELPGVGSARIMADMDAWGYTFRLGSARAWFEGDAEDARSWLMQRGHLSSLASPRALG